MEENFPTVHARRRGVTVPRDVGALEEREDGQGSSPPGSELGQRVGRLLEASDASSL